MALKKKKNYKNGTSAEYHNIGSIELIPYSVVHEVVTQAPNEEERKKSPYPLMNYEIENSLEEGYQMIVHVRSYVSESVRRQDASQYLSSSKKYKKIQKQDFNSIDIFKQAYALLKESEEFSDAENV